MSNYSVKVIDPPPMYSSERPTEVDTSTAFESSSDLIIGIDFGTTFTGVAYAHSGSGTKSATATSSDMRKVGEKVVVIKSWPSQSGYYAEKTPTVIAYNLPSPNWGASVKPRDEPQIAHFKLGLQENVGRHYLTRSTAAANSALGGFLNNHNWKHPDLPAKNAVDYSADYLTCVCDYVTKEILPSHFGANFLKNQQVSYVITVPAIWSDKAKELTRQAAIRAGITRRKLMLITEPEAAALACATLCDEVDLREGDRFLVCDAGGGTVVCIQSD
jgi:molecular chaperone DnaK (HSP70)